VGLGKAAEKTYRTSGAFSDTTLAAVSRFRFRIHCLKFSLSTLMPITETEENQEFNL